MRPFEEETRTCPDCGQPFTAWSIQLEDIPCPRCGTIRHEKRMTAARVGRAYTIDSLGGACPTQALGRTEGGRPYYFRARHGDWTLDVGEPEWGEYGDWPDWSWETTRIASGDDPTGGFVEDETVLEILDRELANR